LHKTPVIISREGNMIFWEGDKSIVLWELNTLNVISREEDIISRERLFSSG
jgi:hypothetical protein